jgi:hypothetical protein
VLFLWDVDRHVGWCYCEAVVKLELSLMMLMEYYSSIDSLIVNRGGKEEKCAEVESEDFISTFTPPSGHVAGALLVRSSGACICPRCDEKIMLSEEVAIQHACNLPSMRALRERAAFRREL